MHFFEIEDRRYAQFERLCAQANVAHAFSTRPQDVSARRDAREAERAGRRRQMARDIGLDPEKLCHCVQIHDRRIAVIDAPRPSGPLEGVDAVATALPGVPLMSFSADCPLVLAVDPVRGAIGLAHASWRCTVAGLTEKLVQTMVERLGCVAGDMLAGVGPGAGPCCYEVGRDVRAAAAALPEHETLFATREGRLYFDLRRANAAQLARAGVRPENVEVAEVCTLCRNDLFYSFRREGPGCGHFGLMAALKEA